jgi:hypothetical protein
MRSSFTTLQVLATIAAVTEAQKGAKGGLGGAGAAAGPAGGSGKYKANSVTDPSLPKHTIYAPTSAPAGEKLPMLTWGNSGCAGDGIGFGVFLSEIASHGYVVVVSGEGSAFTTQTTNKDMTDSITWATTNPAAAKYNIDVDRIGTAGQSCGGIQAMHVGTSNPKVKLITLFNSGSLGASDTAAAKTVKVPIGFFLGGSSDIAFANVCTQAIMRLLIENIH